MRIKIISDGTPSNTKVINAETGERIFDITGIVWQIDADNLAKATVDFILIPVEVEAEIKAPKE